MPRKLTALDTAVSGVGEPVLSAPVLTRRELRERERAQSMSGETDGVIVEISGDDAVTDSSDSEAPIAAPSSLPATPIPIASVVTVVPAGGYARLLESIEPAGPRTRAEARRRREAASLDTVAFDITSIAPSLALSSSPSVASEGSTEEVASPQAPTAPVAGHPRSSRALAASSVAAARPSMPKSARSGSSRRVAAKLFSGSVMAIVALMAVATSVPANALLTAEDVQAAQLMTVQNVAPGSDEPVQSVAVAAGTDSITIDRDGYESSTVAEVAIASGIRMESTFTNNPNATVQWPFAVGVHIGDQFGYRDCAGCSSNHGGQDFNPGDGAPIQSIADGIVVLAEDGEGSLGVHMIIEHEINGETIASVYAHMQHGTMQFSTGDIVTVGQIIGNTGSTGMSTGPHLHFEIRLGGINGTKTDPLQWLYANTN